MTNQTNDVIRDAKQLGIPKMLILGLQHMFARLHRPYVKLFEEERELTVMLLVDVSGSLDFGTTQQTKRHQ